jgi:predicted nucleotidyltransferase component of viral defense system
MIDFEKIVQIAKNSQTRVENVTREYIQHLFLFHFYQQKGSENVLFKGGTALKIIYQSPRFSEDLDFSAENFKTKKRIEDLFINTLAKISKENIPIELREAKFTAEGYLGILFYKIYGLENEVFFEVSFRKKKLKKEITTIVSEYLPPYIVVQLSPEEIVREKINALLERGKPRDYYDFYFILKHPILRKYLKKENLLAIKENIQEKEIDVKKDLSVLLPVTHHQVLKNFKRNLLFEIEKYF